MHQLSLWTWENPLKKNFSKEFFLNLPTQAGIYTFKDCALNPLYVGKAKNLKKRIGSYRSINPNRSSKRLCRLVNHTRKIEFQVCESEEAALLLEAKLIAAMKPAYNRALVAPEVYVYLAVYKSSYSCVLSIQAKPDPKAYLQWGAFKSKWRLAKSLSKLLKLVELKQNLAKPQSAQSFRSRLIKPALNYELPLSFIKDRLLLDIVSGESTEALDELEVHIHYRDFYTSYYSILIEDMHFDFESLYKKLYSLRKKQKVDLVQKAHLNQALIQYGFDSL